jgi:small subunit ribosomal protein S17
MSKKTLIGKIVSDRMKNTVVVEVERIKEHPKYKRRYGSRKKYKAHVEEGDYRLGEKVVIEECRPLSKDKHWKVIKKSQSKKEETVVPPVEEPSTP